MTRDDDAVWQGVAKGAWKLLALAAVLLAAVVVLVFR